jgi:HD-GYP domain-containing protein (c-di-GMP phosphodiesterase class II)
MSDAWPLKARLGQSNARRARPASHVRQNCAAILGPFRTEFMTPDTLTIDAKLELPLEAPRLESLAAVRVDDLIIGRPLKHPLYDEHGVLLLAEGSVITSEFKRLLRQRKFVSIRANEADVARISLSAADLADRRSAEALALDSAVATQLDQLIDSGLLAFENRGPAYKQNVVFHGRKAYNLEKHQALRHQRTATAESLENMMKETLHGRAVSSSVVNTLAAQYLADLSDDTDSVLSVAMEISQDASIADHCFKMSMLGTAIGIELGMDEENCRRLFVAGLVHDWGMAKVPADIRNATHVLSAREYFEIKKHPIYTAEILDRMPGIPSLVSLISYQVHERPNGLGYPRGRVGNHIHLLAKILGAADRFVALTEDRPHRRPLAPYAAMECLVHLAHSRDVDPEVVRAMLKVMCLFPIGSFVALNDGSVAQVIRRNGDHYATPIVQLVQDADGQSISRDDDSSILDLADSELEIVQALPTPGRDETLLTEDIIFPTRSR